MVWRLKLFDDAGDLIGWATFDPHEYWVDNSHPDEGYVSSTLKTLGSTMSITTETRWVTEDGSTYPAMDTMLYENTTPPRDRLEQVAVELEGEGWVDSYEITEE